jgi:hypothetical protein
MSIGRVFSLTFGVMGSNPITVFGIALLFGAIPQQLISYLFATMRAGSPALMIPLAFAGGLVSLVLNALVQGGVIRATIAHGEGREASFGECVATGLRVALPVIGLSILLGLGVMIASMLLIVPGLILFVMWSVSIPAMVAERTGVFGAFGRSRALTAGQRWRIFGLFVVVFVLYFIAAAILGVVLFSTGGATAMVTMAQQGVSITLVIVNLVFVTLFSAFISALQSALYVDLRKAKDGPATHALIDIFE